MITAWIEPNGVVVGVSYGTAEQPPPRGGLTGVVVPSMPVPGESYIKYGAIHDLPARPAEWSEFDLDTESWIDPRTPEQVSEWDAAALAAARAGMTLSFSQLLAGLVAETWITEAEGEAWAFGSALPASAVALIGTLPTAQQFPAKARMLRMSTVLRLDPLVIALATAEGKTDAEIDDFFTTYATI